LVGYPAASKIRGMDVKIVNVGNTPNQNPLEKINICSNEPDTFTRYTFKERSRNDHFEQSLIPVQWVEPSEDPCGIASSLSILHNKVDKINRAKGRSVGRTDAQNKCRILHIATQSKWNTTMIKGTHDVNTGELLASSEVISTDVSIRLKRRKSALNGFVDHFDASYRSRSISMLSLTFTKANETTSTIRSVLDNFRKRCKRNDCQVFGYFWVLDISANLHVHYHVLVAVQRIDIKGKPMPLWLKMHDVWNRHTEVAFVRKSLRGYLAKYLEKNRDMKVLGKRMYGKSILKIKPKLK